METNDIYVDRPLVVFKFVAGYQSYKAIILKTVVMTCKIWYIKFYIKQSQTGKNVFNNNDMYKQIMSVVLLYTGWPCCLYNVSKSMI